MLPRQACWFITPVFEGESDNSFGVLWLAWFVQLTENLLASAVGDMDVYIRVTDTGFEAEDSPILFETQGYEGSNRAPYN